nr:SHOCT domain-containing protein [Mycobacterium sp. Marseille-P9652]
MGWGWRDLVMYIALAAVLVAVAVAVAFAIRNLVGSGQYKASPAAAPRPEDTLAHRFARGEIDEEEYRHGVALLSEHRESL